MEGSWINNYVAIITGGASGIGKAIACAAAAANARVVIADLNEQAGLEVVAQLEKQGLLAHFIKTDVTVSEEIQRLVEYSMALGPIKYLANSAGLQTYGTAETTSEETWDKTIDVNLKSMYLTARAMIPEIRKNGGGGIVNISSIQGMRCQKNVLAYATSKGAVISLTRSMGLDHAGEGISVNCICPGSVDTPLLRYGAAQHGPVDQVLEEWGNHHPIGRIGTAAEIAQVAMFLWSPASNFMVGQAVVADGGLGSVIL